MGSEDKKKAERIRLLRRKIAKAGRRATQRDREELERLIYGCTVTPDRVEVVFETIGGDGDYDDWTGFSDF